MGRKWGENGDNIWKGILGEWAAFGNVASLLAWTTVEVSELRLPSNLRSPFDQDWFHCGKIAEVFQLKPGD